jgi:ribonucleoside-triphosphate reductase
MGVQTGSKSVITLNLNRIIQDWFNIFKLNYKDEGLPEEVLRNKFGENLHFYGCKIAEYITNILERVYKYHTAYNELLWDMYNSGLLPVYTAGFINLNKQYLTVGLNGLNQAAEFLGIRCSDNEEYKKFCQTIFSIVKEQNTLHKTKKTTYNTEQVPAESLAAKNYKWDLEDGYVVPQDTNLYASYIFKPNDPNTSVLEKLRLHGRDYIGDYLDGGAAAHIGLDHHLDKEQYWKLINYAAEVGCQYFTFNVPNCECEDCGYIAKQPFDRCPKCGSTNVSLWDRIIGYLTKIKNWSEPRRIEQKTRVYSSEVC